MRKVLSLILVVILYISPVLAQNSTSPVPYDPDEFPQWLKDVRRTESIFFGLLPLAVLYSTIAYDIYRFSDHAIRTGGVDAAYLPSIINSAHAPFNSDDEKIIIWAALSVAAVFAIVDLIIYLVRDRKQMRRTRR